MLETTGNTLNDIIQGGNWRKLLEQDAKDNASLVDVSQEPRNTNGLHFKMHCSETIPSNNDVVLFFPNSNKNNTTNTIIDTRKYTAYPALERAIDAALKATTLGGAEGSLPFAIHHRGYYYRFWKAHVHHTYYVLWMTDFTEFNDRGPKRAPLCDTPVVFELNGLGKIVGVTPLCYTGYEEGTWGPIQDPAEYISKIHFPMKEIFTREVVMQKSFPSSSSGSARTIGHEGGRLNIKNVNVTGTASLEIEPSADLELEGLDAE